MKDKSFSSDIWYVSSFNIAKYRQNQSNPKKKLIFTDILQEQNKEIVKEYTARLLEQTDMSLSTIFLRLSLVKKFVRHIGCMPLEEIQRNDILLYIKALSEERISAKTYNANIYMVAGFLDFCERTERIKSRLVYPQDIRTTSVEYALHTIDEKTIHSIFEIIDRIPTILSLMFLTLYCTGMRVSEVCILERDCVYRANGAAFIKFYQTKMRKEVTNPIPANLAELLEKRIQMTEGKYMWEAPRGGPYRAGVFRAQMKKSLEPFEIKTPDGECYSFKPHSLRHTFAAGLINRDVPLSVVNKLLHHLSLEMTLAYTRVTDFRRLLKYAQFVDTNAVSAEIPKEIEISWLRENIAAQTVPGGICVLPVELGVCPHGNVCLDCGFFRTSRAYTDSLKVQLADTEALMNLSERMGYIAQYEKNKHIHEKLKRLVEALEHE